MSAFGSLNYQKKNMHVDMIQGYHGCYAHDGLSMDALVILCFRNTNVFCDFGMDALVILCFRNTNVIMVLAWMLW